jgi:hypothetical protein
MRCPHCGKPCEEPRPDPDLPWLLTSYDRKFLRGLRIDPNKTDGQNGDTEEERHAE